MEDIKTKICKSPKHIGEKEVPVDGFSKHPWTNDGLQSYCKACMKIAQREWWENNKEKARQRNRRVKKNRKSGIHFTKKASLISRYEKFYTQYQEKYFEDFPKYLKIKLTQIKHRAKKRGIEFNLTIDDFPKTAPLNCPVLGIPLHFRSMSNTPSIDRIDSRKGYIKGNVIIVSMRANTLKSNATPEEHLKIYEFYKEFI